MNILMMTNTYAPLVGGLEKSVETFTKEYRRRGHRVVVVAPEFKDQLEREEDVIRIPSIQHISGTEFSVKLPIPGILNEALGDFKPDIVHSHHPFLMGSTALRVAYKNDKPLVFTHHTLFEQNTHYFPGGDTEVVKRFVIQLSTGYANLADQVFAPSQSVVSMLRDRGVETPIEIVPTGVDVNAFAEGDGAAVRSKLGIPNDAFVVGYVGRLSQEKNLGFLCEAVILFLKANTKSYFVIAGKGPLEDSIKESFKTAGVLNRLCLAGMVQGGELVGVYRAMNVFAFASHSETQGIVLAEAMASGIPVVGLDAPGVREVIHDGENGWLLLREDAKEFSGALEVYLKLPEAEKEKVQAAALQTADRFSMTRCTDHALGIYQSLLLKDVTRRKNDDNPWDKAMRRFNAEWDMMKTLTKATTDAVLKS